MGIVLFYHNVIMPGSNFKYENAYSISQMSGRFLSEQMQEPFSSTVQNVALLENTVYILRLVIFQVAWIHESHVESNS